MNMQSTGDENELLNSDDDSILDESKIMTPMLKAFLDEVIIEIVFKRLIIEL